MDQMEKSSVLRTRVYNDFPRRPAQQGDNVTAPTLAPSATDRRIWFFEDGDGSMKELLGGKGAGLAEMTRAGLPVPPGFTITTQVCLAYYAAGGKLPEGLRDELRAAIREL